MEKKHAVYWGYTFISFNRSRGWSVAVVAVVAVVAATSNVRLLHATTVKIRRLMMVMTLLILTLLLLHSCC